MSSITDDSTLVRSDWMKETLQGSNEGDLVSGVLCTLWLVLLTLMTLSDMLCISSP